MCDGGSDVKSFYSLSMTVTTVGKVGNTLQPTLGINPSRPSEPCIERSRGGFGQTQLFGRIMGWAGLAQFRQVTTSIAPIRRLVNFGPIDRVIFAFLANSLISLILDIVRLIDYLF